MMKMQPENEQEPALLGDLLAGGEDTLADVEILDDVRKQKPKRKRKPKPQPRLKMILIVTAVAAILLGMALLFIAPVQQDSIESVAQPVNEVVSAEIALPAQALDGNTDNALVAQWLVTTEQAASIAPGTLVFVLNKSPRGEWYNVADRRGNIALVTPAQLGKPLDPLPDNLEVPVGPFGSAINKMEKLVVVLDQHGDIAPGTPVYVMGWRAEDGMWIYQVSEDLVKPEYVPSNFLAWAEGG